MWISLNNDMFMIIYDNLNIHDKMNLNNRCKTIYNIMDEHLHQLYHKCIKEIEHEWDKYASIFIKESYTNKLDKYDQKFCIKCSIIPDKYHYLSVNYTIFRDLNRLSWYEDDKLMGLSLL